MIGVRCYININNVMQFPTVYIRQETFVSPCTFIVSYQNQASMVLRVTSYQFHFLLPGWIATVCNKRNGTLDNYSMGPYFIRPDCKTSASNQQPQWQRTVVELHYNGAWHTADCYPLILCSDWSIRSRDICSPSTLWYHWSADRVEQTLGVVMLHSVRP